MPPSRQTSPGSQHSHETQLNACVKCKVRKKKCDRVRPRCSNCSRSNSDCVYEVPSSDAQQKLLIARLTADNEAQKAQVAQLQQRVDAFAASQTIFFPTPPAVSPNTSLLAFTASHVEVTNAERIVMQMFEGEVDLMNTQQSLLASTAQQLGLPFNHGQSSSDSNISLNMSPSMVTRSCLPDIVMAEKMIAMYFDYTNYFHPLLDRETVAEDMRLIYPSAPQVPSILDNLTGPDIRVFRLFMVLAIGCNILPKSTAASVDVIKLRSCASAHFTAALRADTMTCMTGIALYCIVTMTDSAHMDPYQNIRRAAKLSLSLGLHKDDETLAWDVREIRKKIFWSIFSMDRSICFTLVRPVTISENDIATSLPQSVPDLSPLHVSYMRPIALFHQTVLLRRLQGIVVTEINLAPAGSDNAEDVSTRIRNQIDSWYDSLPRTGSRARTFPYLEVNYHLLLVRLYSPSSLFPHTPPAVMGTLRESAYRVIEMYGAEQDDHRIAQNHITLAHIVACCIALVYTLIECEGAPSNLKLVSWRRKAMQHIESAERYMTAFCAHATHAAKYPEAFRRLTRDVQNRIHDADEADRKVDDLHPIPEGLVSAVQDGCSEVTLFDAVSTLPNQQQQFTLPWDMLLDQNQALSTFTGEEATMGGENFDDILTSLGLGAFSA